MMNTDNINSSDLIQEFRLRSWARRNYVAPEQRSNSWNPIVLDEMQQHDSELQQCDTTLPSSGLGYVPLEPTGQTHLHTAHTTINAPHMLQVRERDIEYVDEVSFH